MGLISVILPFCNQHTDFTDLAEYTRVLADLESPFELLPIVSGDRRDDFLKMCRTVSQKESGIRVFSLEAQGWGRAVQRGLAEARGDVLCYAHSSHTSPQDLHRVLGYALSHPDDVIKANRRIHDGLVPRLGSLLYVAECRWLFDLPYWDINGTPKVFPRKLSKLLALKSQDDLVDLEFEVVCRREGYRVLEVPLPTIGRQAVRQTTNLISAWHLYVGAYRLWKQMQTG
jgi:hypothetical protein